MNKICPNCGTDNSYENFDCEVCNSNLKLNDKYYLIEVLGEGNQITYLAEDLSQNSVIIKEFSISSLDDWKQEELFKREIVVLRSLNHKQIPKLIDDFEIIEKKEKTYYLVMEFIDGSSLKEEIDKSYHEEDILLIIEELIVLLDYIHSFNPPIIHRDLKPSNIIRDKNNSLNLIDFGAVTDILKPEGGSTIVGTYGYMAPEQFMGRATIQSDYYSLGAIIVRFLTNKDLGQTIDITDLSFVNKLTVSDKMKVILKKLLSVELDERVKSTKEILELIKSYRDDTLDISQVNIIAEKIVEKREIKEIKKRQEVKKQNIRKELKDFKKEYKKLEKMKSSIKKPIPFITIGILSVGFIAMWAVLLQPLNEIVDDAMGLLIFPVILITLVLTFLSLRGEEEKKDKTISFEKLEELFDDELVYLFLERNRKEFQLSSLFLKNRKRKLNNGKIILYEKLLKEWKEK